MSKNTTRKVVGSLAIAGTAAAVAGLGTFGTFTDSTAPLATSVTTGSVDINVAQPGVSIPANITGFVPGDSLSRVVDLSNDGSSPLASLTLNSTAAAPSILTTDQTNGLQLSVKSCSVAYTQGGTAQAPTYSCTGGTETSLAGGPAVHAFGLSGLASMNPQGVDHLLVTVSLPTSADNTFQGKSASLSLTFTGTQRTGQNR